MDIVSLARFQFAMTTVYHFFFVPFSIGTAFAIAIMETIYVRTKNEVYKKMARYWGNIFLLSFAVGVVTGLIQEFQFGMNWSDYSRFMGDIFGAPLAFEALLAFFMESTFIGLWTFTWNKVKPGVHALFIWMTSIGSMISALWILTANSFMQNPVGYTIKDGRAEMTDFFALLKNPQLFFEYGHVIGAALMMGGVIVAGLTGFQLLRAKKQPVSDETKHIYKTSMRFGMWVSLIFAVLTIAVGHAQMQYLIKEQPMKFAATEAIYKNTKDPAGLALVGVADQKNHELKGSIEIPGMLSFMSYNKFSGSLTGIDEVNKDLTKKYGKYIAGEKMNYYPPVNTLFWSFRIMVGVGMWVALVSIVALFLTRKGKETLYEHKWMLWVVALTTFLPFIGNTVGWFVTEFGRYPWTVYGLFTIKQSVSPTVSVASLLTSNIVYFVLFTALAVVMIGLVIKELHKDPANIENPQLLEKFMDPFDKGAF